MVATAALTTTQPSKQTSLRWCQYDDTPRHWCILFIINGLTAVIPLPIHFMLQCGLFINHRRHIHLEKTFLGKEKALKHPLHLSSFCAMRESASRWSPSIQIFFGRHAALVSLPVTPERPITMMVLSICQLLTMVKPTVAHSLLESELSWSGLNMVANWS